MFSLAVSLSLQLVSPKHLYFLSESLRSQKTMSVPHRCRCLLPTTTGTSIIRALGQPPASRFEVVGGKSNISKIFQSRLCQQGTKAVFSWVTNDVLMNVDFSHSFCFMFSWSKCSLVQHCFCSVATSDKQG